MKKFTFKEIVLSFGLLFGVTAQAQQLYTEPFTNSLNTAIAANGSSGAWVWTNSCGKSSLSGHTANGSALFQGSGCQFGNGGNVVSGDLTTPGVVIPSLGGILTFNYYLENECGSSGGTCSYDVLSVQMSNNGGSSYTTLMSSNTGTFTNGSAWKSVTYNIAGSQTVMFRFSFNSIDGISNAFDGVYVDDISIFGIQPCTGTPAANTVVATSTLVCPVFGTSSLSILNPYTGVGGITYTWQVSNQSALGAYTNVIGANTTAYTTPTLNTTTWYQLAITCANGGTTTLAAPVQIQVATTTTNTVPYFESFEGITLNNQLPNCSWFRSDNFQATTRTSSASVTRIARTGNKFAEFDASNYVYGQTRYFYSNGIQMYAGITYSASVWYITPGYTPWNNLGLLFGPNQSPTGLTLLASIGNPNNSTYNSLSNTFMVPTSGLYFMAVRATEAYYGSQISWDDLQVIAPCQFTNNSAPVAIAGPMSICAGQTAVFNASGSTTYSWNTGVNTSSISVSPTITTTYSITGINPLSGCSSTTPRVLEVNQLPPIAILASQNPICQGKNVNLIAVGANSFTWSVSSSGVSGPVAMVSPTANTTYSVFGANAFGCIGTAAQEVTVNALPTVSVTGKLVACAGEQTSLTGLGASTYTWSSNTFFLVGSPVSISPVSSSNYMVAGTDAQGCVGTLQRALTVEACTGIEARQITSGLTIFPNPSNGFFTVEMANGLEKNIQVADVTGRVVLNVSSEKDQVDMNISTLANGVYYVTVKSLNSVDVIKVVKQ